MINKLFAILVLISLSACNNNRVINKKLIDKHLITLSSDEMEGRRAGSDGIEKATKYIESEFEKIGLSKYDTLNSYRQNFEFYGRSFNNVVGVLKGKSLSDEYILVSAHYDHLGIDKEKEGDNIYNGANDNASGVTAVLTLAKHFKKLDLNERSIIFIAFTAEEMGLRGSRYFGKSINPDDFIAGVNIEMIGTKSEYGKNTVWLTGFDRSSFGKIIQKSLSNTKYKIIPDPYPKQNLFFRSDNAPLARLGIPAHTFSTTAVGKDANYHKVTDEYKTLDVQNIKEITNLISIGILSIIQGKDTPTRVMITE